MLTKIKLLNCLAISVLLFPFTSCAQKTDSTDFFSKLNFYKDTLYIKARFMECGEWGGHLEQVKIFLKEDNFYLSYNKYKADCTIVNANSGEPTQTLEQSFEKPLSNRDKELIKQYTCQLIIAKFREPNPMNAGYNFEMKNTDETLNVHVYTWGRTTKDEYLNFIDHLLN